PGVVHGRSDLHRGLLSLLEQTLRLAELSGQHIELRLEAGELLVLRIDLRGQPGQLGLRGVQLRPGVRARGGGRERADDKQRKQSAADTAHELLRWSPAWSQA